MLMAALMAAVFSTPLRASDTESSAWQLVNYWSEWCAPCRVEIPMLNQLSELFSPEQVVITGVNFDEDPRAVTLDIAADMDIRFYVLTMTEVGELNLRPPDVLPTTYILAPDNSVVAKLIGEQSKDDILDALKELGLTIPIEAGRGLKLDE
ncbi:MAG: TlpA family protein disulfide reductase [Pseudohongiellaceae bacterium]